MSVNLGIREINKARDIAIRAGREIMDVFRSDFAVQTKSDASPVTEADRRAEELIIEAIRNEITDEFPIVGEESVSDGNIPDITGTPFWLVDPLDGTKEFVKRGHDFTVNIALIENGMPIFGVVHLPAVPSTYWGSRMGAFAEGDGAGERQIHCRPMPDDGVVAIVSKSHRSPEVDTYLKAYTVKKEISAGSSMKFCRVATGLADLYPRLGRTMEWDTAAGHAVLRFAGGRVETMEGRELAYGKAGFENPNFVALGGDPGRYIH